MSAAAPAVLPSPATASQHGPLTADRAAAILSGCSSARRASELHAAVLRAGAFRLQRAYATSGRLDLAVSLLRRTPNPTTILYTSAIHAHASRGLHSAALALLSDMLFHGLHPTAHTIPACSSSPLLLGRALHAHAVKLALAADAYVATALLGAYARAGDAAAARKLFDAMQSFPDPPHLDSVTAMITCYAETGALDDARSLLDELPHKDFICACSDEVAVVLALTAVESGRWVHSYVKNNSRRRVRISARVGTALIDMYYKCGSFGGRRRRVRTRPRT